MTTLQPLTPSDVKYTDHKDHLLQCFNEWVATEDNRLHVLLDDGVYRHLRFKKDQGFGYWFELITWPGYLTITGDMGTFTFSRLNDMFEFFTGYINTGYWAEKLKHGSNGGRDAVRKHDEDLFKAWVLADFWETSRDLDHEETRQWWQSLRRDILDDYAYLNTADVNDCIERLMRLQDQPDSHYADVYESAGFWEQYDWHFELCLAAIVTGIRTYQAHKKEQS